MIHPDKFSLAYHLYLQIVNYMLHIPIINIYLKEALFLFIGGLTEIILFSIILKYARLSKKNSVSVFLVLRGILCLLQKLYLSFSLHIWCSSIPYLSLNDQQFINPSDLPNTIQIVKTQTPNYFLRRVNTLYYLCGYFIGLIDFVK